MKLPPSGDGPPAREWILVGMTETSVQGKPEYGNHSYLYIVKNSLPVSHLTWSEMTIQTTVSDLR